MGSLLDKPAWLVELVFSLIGIVAKLVAAETDEEQEEALMLAAEATKAAADRRRFG